MQSARSGPLRGRHPVRGARWRPSARPTVNFSAAHGLLSSPLLWPVDVLPVAGRQLRSVQDLSGAAGQVARTGITTVNRSQSLLRLPHTAARNVWRHCGNSLPLARPAPRRPVQPSIWALVQGLIGPLAHERNTFQSDLTQIRAPWPAPRRPPPRPPPSCRVPGPTCSWRATTPRCARARVRSSRPGPSPRATASSISRHGAHRLADPPPGRRPVGGDLEARWGWLHPRGRLAEPRTDPPVRRQRPTGGQHVEGEHGPERRRRPRHRRRRDSRTSWRSRDRSRPPPGRSSAPPTSTSSSCTTSTSARPTTRTRRARIDELSTLASATLHALEDRPFKLHTMADALSSAAAGRHVLLWSADPRTEDAWRGAGVSGQLQPSSLMADIINRGGNKLDQYLSETVVPPAHAHGTARPTPSLTMTFANRTPPGQSPFIAGPYPGPRHELRRVRGDRHGQPPRRRARHHIAPSHSVVTSGPEGPTILEGATSTSCRGRPRASPSTSCCPRPTAP